jgi:putative ABC transport system ATP-binding protein
MSYIQVENISKQYGSGDASVMAVKDMTFIVEKGAFVAVMGQSGSGKSTLLSILGTLNRPTQGTLLIDGVDVYGLKADQRADFRRKSVGFIFQNFNLIPYLTTLENVMIPMAPLRLSKRKKQEAGLQALEHVGLAGKAGRLPGQISGGEQERVAIARAIVNRPPILLADEPTGNLDSTNGRSIMELLSILNSQGSTVIMVTHTSEYAQYADSRLNIADGMIVMN